MRALACITVSAALCWLAPSCWIVRDESPFGDRVCNDDGDCNSSCGIGIWDDEHRVARSYGCTLRDNRHACVCDGSEAATQPADIDCSEALSRACDVSTSYPGYCRNEGGMCWPRTDANDGAWFCRCDGSEAVVEGDDPLCESALFQTCPVSCESEHGSCTSGEETYSYDCDCDVGPVTLQESDSCDWALRSACEPRCSGELGQCYERDDGYRCACGEEQQLVSTPTNRSCGEAMVVACAGIAPDDCSRETETVHAECQLDGNGYSCLCSTTFPGGAGVRGIGDLGTWRETDDGWTLDITCDEALQQACFE